MKYKREFNVYRIVNDIDDRVYIGSTVTELWHRMSQHRANARKGAQSELYNLMRAYGISHFKIELVKRSTAQDIRRDEEEAIAAVPPEKRLNFKCKCRNDTSIHFDYDLICSVYEKVLSQNQTANIIGCSRITVQKALKSRNVEIYYPPHTAYKHRRNLNGRQDWGCKTGQKR